MAKQMILVDPQQWWGATAAAGVPPPPPSVVPDGLSTTISYLDRDMKDILMDSGIDDYTKAHRYQQALQRYLLLADKYRHKPLGRVEISMPQTSADVKTVEPDPNKIKATPTAGDVKTVETERSNIKSTVVQAVPPQFRNKAELLWKQIENTPGLSWDNKNQLMVGNEVIQGSNIIDLVNDLVRSRKRLEPPKGWMSLASALKRANTPREAIGNPERWKWMEDSASDVYKEEKKEGQTPRRRSRISRWDKWYS